MIPPDHLLAEFVGGPEDGWVVAVPGDPWKHPVYGTVHYPPQTLLVPGPPPSLFALFSGAPYQFPKPLMYQCEAPAHYRGVGHAWRYIYKG